MVFQACNCPHPASSLQIAHCAIDLQTEGLLCPGAHRWPQHPGGAIPLPPNIYGCEGGSLTNLKGMPFLPLFIRGKGLFCPVVCPAAALGRGKANSGNMLLLRGVLQQSGGLSALISVSVLVPALGWLLWQG